MFDNHRITDSHLDQAERARLIKSGSYHGNQGYFTARREQGHGTLHSNSSQKHQLKRLWIQSVCISYGKETDNSKEQERNSMSQGINNGWPINESRQFGFQHSSYIILNVDETSGAQ